MTQSVNEQNKRKVFVFAKKFRKLGMLKLRSISCGIFHTAIRYQTLASHQHFVKKEEKRGSAFLEKRGFLIKKRRKRGIQFSSEETKTHRHNSTINPTKLVSYKYRLNMT
jgi:hypothetical protein